MMNDNTTTPPPSTSKRGSNKEVEEEKKAATPSSPPPFFQYHDGQLNFAAAVTESMASKGGDGSFVVRPNGSGGNGASGAVGNGSGSPQQQQEQQHDEEGFAETGGALLFNPLQGATPVSSPSRDTATTSNSNITKPVHNRTVSWGMASPIPPPQSQPTSSSVSPMPPPTNFQLNDVLMAGPTEQEAETYILQAVEKVSSQAHQRTHTETDRLLARIAEVEIQKSLQNTKENVNEEVEEEMHENDQQQQQQQPPKPLLQKQQSSSQSTTTTTTKSRFQGLVKKQMKSSTVEGNLFSLTSALAELDGSNKTHSRKDSYSFDTNFTAADKLNHTAAHQLNIMGNNSSHQQHTTNKIDEEDTDDDDDDDDLESQPSLSIPTGEALTSSTTLDHNNNPMASSSSSTKKKKKKRKRKKKGVSAAVKDGVKEEWELFNSYLGQRKAYMKAYAKKIIMSLFLPSLGMAFFLFYIIEDPNKCLKDENNVTMAPNDTTTTFAPQEVLLEEEDEFDDFTMMVINGDNDNNFTATRAPDKDFSDLFTTCDGLGASASWWFLFLGVRQVITFTMALVTQSFIIDYLALGSRISLDWFGPIVTLLVVQSKGWPFILIFWAIYDLILLCGDHDYVHHWGFWQDWLAVFSEENPSGNVVSNDWNRKILGNAIFVGVCVAVKRLVVGLMLGRQTFVHYGEQLASLLKNMVLIGEVATLAKEIERYAEDTSMREEAKIASDQSVVSTNSGGGFGKNIQDMVVKADEDAHVSAEQVATSADAAKAFIASRNAVPEVPKSPGSPLTPSQPPRDPTPDDDSDSGVVEGDPEFTQSEQFAMMELLEAWEEPMTAEEKEEKNVTLAAVLQFRQSLTYMKKKYPFLPAFGPADTRDKCIESSQRVYDRLLMRTPHRGELPFETLALLAKDEHGGIDQEKAKELIRVFRPDRDGALGKLEFVKSIDSVYKELRLLAANISNSSQMDVAVENLVNVVFYIVLGAIVINRLGENPLTLFFSFSSIILAFAFMFGRSSAKYFDGCLFILVQRPYGVGDRMHLSNPFLETSPEGSSGWIVEKITLYTTSVYWAATNERATLCNGAISNLRVINAARSPNAVVFVPLKFAIDTPYEKIEIFKAAVEQFLKDRPREWLTFSGFRPTEVAVDKGFIGYKVIAQHRNGWQQVGTVIESKANLTTYCLEITKQLDMRYMSPHLPVDLNIKDDDISMPLLPGEEEEYEMSGGPKNADSDRKSASDAWASLATGLRQRKTAAAGKGKTDFAALVRMAVAANRNKGD